MEEILSALVGAVNQVLWDYLLIYALIGIGLFFTLYLGAPQVTKLGTGFQICFRRLVQQKRQRPRRQISVSISSACRSDFRANRYR